jgi:hypothetical protein
MAPSFHSSSLFARRAWKLVLAVSVLERPGRVIHATVCSYHVLAEGG